MTKLLPRLLAVLTGIVVLAGYLFQATLGHWLTMIFDWGILLLGMSILLGVGYLLWFHIRKISLRGQGMFMSVVVWVAFIITLISALANTPQHNLFRDLVLNIQIPVEASLLAILAVTLLVSTMHLIKTRGWTPMSISFIASALLSLGLNIIVWPGGPGSLSADFAAFFRRLPHVGIRGILLGAALGGLIMGLRVLLTIDRPYGE